MVKLWSVVTEVVVMVRYEPKKNRSKAVLIVVGC